MAGNDALAQALAAFRDPSRVADLRERPLADDVLLVLRIAAGEQAAINLAQQRTSDKATALQEAAVFYLQQALFSPNGTAYRVLGCGVDAAQERLRENYRWLIKWLHPDRNTDQWESVYADKVNIAWQALKTPDRRSRYDASNGIDGLQLEAGNTGLALKSAVRPEADPKQREILLSGTVVRHLPAITLSVMGLGAAVLLGLMYWVNQESSREAATGALAQSDYGQAVVTEPDEPIAKQVVEPVIPSRDEISVDSEPADLPRSQWSLPVAGDQALTGDGVQTDRLESEPSGLAAPGEDAHKAVERLLAAGELAQAGPDVASSVFPSAVAMEVQSPDEDDMGPLASTPAESSGPNLAAAPVANALMADPEPAPIPPKAAAPAAVLQQSRPEQQPATAAIAIADQTPAASTLVTKATAAESPKAPAQPRPTSTPSPTAIARVAQANPMPNAAEPRTQSAPMPPPAPTSSPPAAIVRAAPFAASVQAAPTKPIAVALPIASAPSATQAIAVVNDFTSAYTAGDLARFDGLFSGQVTDHKGVSGLRERMRAAQMRYLELVDLRWELGGETAVGYAGYRETFVPEGERRAITRVGNLQWVIRMNGKQPRISAISVQASR